MSRAKKKPIILTDADGQALEKKLKLGNALFLASYVALLLLFTSLNIIRPDGGFPLWLVQCVPLLIFAPGLIQKRYRSYSWVCFVILAYFTWAVVNSMSPLVRWSDLLVTALSVIIFITAMMVSRWLQYWYLYLEQRAAGTDTTH